MAPNVRGLRCAITRRYSVLMMSALQHIGENMREQWVLDLH